MEILKNIRNSYTFGLRKCPQTFLEGATSIVGIREKVTDKYKTDDTDNKADYKALDRDWKAVGQDLYKALETHGHGSSN